MRRCCEETLRVLRQSKDFLLTIIEVFIHDPLYKWALTAKKAQKRQADVEDEGSEVIVVDDDIVPEGMVVNADAERSVLRIRQKLVGLDGGEPCAGLAGSIKTPCHIVIMNALPCLSLLLQSRKTLAVHGLVY